EPDPARVGGAGIFPLPLAYGLPIPAFGGHRLPLHDLLFSYDFPPLGGGISRWMEELARGYPPGSLLVSTGTVADQDEIDQALPNPVARPPISTHRLRTLQGLLLWSRRAAALGRDPEARFAWCGNIRPAGYPAKWAWERVGLPYGILLH